MTATSAATAPQAPEAGEAPAATSGLAAGALQYLFFSGFLTIAVQVMLLREVFTALYGSDVAMGFALGCWTFFGGLGALAGAAGTRQLRRVPALWGFVLFFCAAGACFLAARAWGARDVLRFADYARVPLLVGPPATAGGLLFPWILAGAACAGTGAIPAQAYAAETAGGLWAGVVASAYLWSGGRALSALVLLAACCVLLPIVSKRTGKRTLPALSAVAAVCVLPFAVARTGVLGPLVRASLRLHYPGYRILAHENTPSAALTAVEQGGRRFVFENGIPAAPPEATRADLVVLALAAQFPEQWRLVYVLRPVSSGFCGALRHYAGARVVGWEADEREVRFLGRWLGADWSSVDLQIEPSPWRVQPGAPDLLLVLSGLPNSLADNRWLTREFFFEAADRLAPGGACVVALPAGPGFVHPRRDRVIACIQSAMKAAFPWVQRLHTDAGRLLLIGRRHGQEGPLLFAPERFRTRMTPDVDAGVAAEAASVFLDAELARSLGAPAATKAAPVNTVFFPAAYYEYLRYRGAMVETAPGFWDRVFRRMPAAGWLALVLLLVLTAACDAGARGAGPVFWTSWTATMAVAFSLYLCQCVFGQAYWLLSLVTAAGMAGVCFGAVRRRPARTLGAVVTAFVPLLFVAWPVLHRASPLVILAVICAGNVLVGARVGAVFRRAAVENRARPRAAGMLFGLDLVGASLGLVLGSVLLPWWMGFRASGTGVCVAVGFSELLHRLVYGKDAASGR